MSPHDALQKYWHYTSFRPLQESIISSVLAGKDTLAVMPTGGGKSLCFQIPSLILPGICVVVTPLIALMNDQVLNLKKRGIFALSIHSGMKFHEVKRNLDNAAYGNYKFLYVSPERLETELFLEYLPILKINLVAVDEAHCISQWGYDFRPSYLKIAQLREKIPGVPAIALTASATKEVQKDICEKLLFEKHAATFAQSYERANLSYSVFSPASKEKKLIEILAKVQGSSIVYCKSRKRTKEIASLIQTNGITADFYHAGLSTEERNRKQDEWLKGNIRVICCTNAFGMGIDKPDVRTVVHTEIPDALEYYYQEAGRAGRDGKKSYAVLLFRPEELIAMQSLIALRYPDMKAIRETYAALCNYIGLPAGKGFGLSFNFEITDFVEKFKLNALTASSVIKILEQEGFFTLSDNFFSPSTVEFLASKQTLEEFEKHYPIYTKIIKGLLRSYEGIFDQPCIIDEFTLARFIKMDKGEVIQQLTDLDRKGIITFNPRSDVPQLYFLSDRPETSDLFIDTQKVSERKKAFEKRLHAMKGYATQKEVCRSIYINQYFGGGTIDPCGICDVCLEKKKKRISPELVQKIFQAIRDQRLVTVEHLHGIPGITKEKLLEVIGFLKDENEIVIDLNGKMSIIEKKKGEK